MNPDRHRPAACHLTFFEPLYAARIARWVFTDQELTWLAPATPAPLTTEKVLQWGKGRRWRYLFWAGGDDGPIGYAELNEMAANPAQMWIGHFILSPHSRGRGLALRFAQALLARAFLECAAAEVVLVVFPDNARALRCYQQAGMIALGTERKYFESTGREHQFLRMGMDRARFLDLVAAGRLPDRPLALLPCRDDPAPPARARGAAVTPAG
jgi:RimJ/RimL family protein N-acetyltransferase